MNIDLKAIRAAAEAATHGPWEWDGDPSNYDPVQESPWLVTANGLPVLAGAITTRRKQNADYIATANPATVIALLDRLEAAEKDAARMRDELRRSESLIEQYREEAAHRENPDDYVMQY